MKDLIINEEDDSEKIEGKFYLFLDQVTDPQNFGSILRSALFIGVDGVIVNKTNACGLTPVVSRVSSGALEFIPLYSVKFVSHFFEDAKKDPLNFRIISTNLESGDDSPSSNLKEPIGEDDSIVDQDDIITFDDEGEDEVADDEISFGDMDEGMNKDTSGLISLDELRLPRGPKQNTILILGSEGAGVSRTIAKSADDRVIIPP